MDFVVRLFCQPSDLKPLNKQPSGKESFHLEFVTVPYLNESIDDNERIHIG